MLKLLHELHSIVLYQYRDVLHINIVDEFDIDLCLTFLNNQTKRRWHLALPCEHDSSSEIACIML